jgi:glucose-6-phosphate isomerase
MGNLQSKIVDFGMTSGLSSQKLSLKRHLSKMKGMFADEYFMTEGHFYMVLEAAEVYYCLSGHGYMMVENPKGDWEARELTPGMSLYVPGRYAHRSINVSSTEALVTFFAFPGHAGHDYGTIETKGFRKLMVEHDGKPTIIDNPKWREL